MALDTRMNLTSEELTARLLQPVKGQVRHPAMLVPNLISADGYAEVYTGTEWVPLTEETAIYLRSKTS